MTITVKNAYDPTAAVAADLAKRTAAEAIVIARSAALSSMFLNDDRNQFRLLIDGYHIHEAKSATVMLSIDAAANGFTVVVPCFEQLALLRDVSLSPPRYPLAEVFLGGKKRFTGKLYQRKCKFGKTGRYRTLVGWNPVVDALDSAVTPPLELNQMNLQAIAAKLLGPFGLTIVWSAGVDLPFTRVKTKRDDKVGDVLFKLARQRGIFIMSDEEGYVVFHQPSTALPVAELKEGTPPFDEGEIDLDGRKWFGQYVCYTTAPRGNRQATAVDDRFPVARRTVVSAPEGSDADMKTTAEWAARKHFADGLEFPQPVQSWYTGPLPTDDIWQPNTLVRVISSTMFLKNGFDFLVRGVEFTWDKEQGARANLDLVSPTAYQTLDVQKKSKLSWKARMMLAKATATPLEETLMDEESEE